MQIKALMKPAGAAQKMSGGPTVCEDSSVYTLCPRDFPPAHPVVDVVNAQGKLVGTLSRDVLVYLIENNSLFKMSSIANHFEEAVVAVDKDGRIFYANQGYTTVLGVPLGKVVGRNLKVIESEASLIQVLETRRPITLEKNYIKSIGKYVSVRMFPLFIKNEFQGAISIFTDVTETNKLNHEIRRITEEIQEYKSRLAANESIRRLNIVGDDPNFARTLEQALVVAKTDATVLIRGENGIGKEILAKLIQQNSPRGEGPFITVNCASVPENLIESELFGYEEGAFTGAKKGGRIGKFQLANGGTIFLDEIGDMPLAMQAKLLRVLQENEVEMLGRDSTINVDVRVIAATNQPLEEMIKKKLFRQDLYYRLNVITLVIPPLRERPNDIILLIQHFLSIFNQRYGRRLSIENACLSRLLQYDWPGNVRELKSCIEYAVVLCQGEAIGLRDLPLSMTVAPQPPPEAPPREAVPVLPHQKSMAGHERELLMGALEQAHGNKSEAMRLLGLSRRTFYRKLKLHGIH